MAPGCFTRRRRSAAGAASWRGAGALCLGAVCASAAAQDSGGRSFSIVPTFDTTLTYSTNSGALSEERGSDVITQVRPGVQVFSRSGRIRGSLSYMLDAIHHSKGGQGTELQNSLTAAFVAEVIDNRAFVDVSANVSQRSVSAYGQQFVSDNQATNSNRTEVGTIAVSPYVRGNVGGLAAYEVRLNAAATNGRRSKDADSTNMGGQVSLNSAGGGSVFGWGLQASRQRSDFRTGRATENDRAIASVSAVPDPELRLTLRGGQESTDVGSADKRSYNNWGAEARWTPTDRTTAMLSTDHRYFGQSHQFSFEHRLPQSAIRFSSTRDASTSSNPTGVGQPVTLYQLFFFQFASIQPDPVLRQQLVLDFLRSVGQDPNAVVSGGFINSGVSLQRREDLSFSYAGKRTTFTVQAYTSQSSTLDTTTSATASNAPIRQLGYTASVSYRLTPTATASFTGSQLRTQSTDTQPGNDLKSLSLNWADQLSRYLSATVSARHSVFSSATEPYRESSLSASLSMRF